MDHVALGVPVLVLTIPKDFDKLLQYGSLAAAAALGELRRVVIVTIYLTVVFVIAILRSKHCRAERAGEMVDMILVVEGRDIGPAKSSAALMAQ